MHHVPVLSTQGRKEKEDDDFTELALTDGSFALKVYLLGCE